MCWLAAFQIFQAVWILLQASKDLELHHDAAVAATAVLDFESIFQLTLHCNKTKQLFTHPIATQSIPLNDEFANANLASWSQTISPVSIASVYKCTNKYPAVVSDVDVGWALGRAAAKYVPKLCKYIN